MNTTYRNPPRAGDGRSHPRDSGSPQTKKYLHRRGNLRRPDRPALPAMAPTQIRLPFAVVGHIHRKPHFETFRCGSPCGMKHHAEDSYELRSLAKLLEETSKDLGKVRFVERANLWCLPRRTIRERLQSTAHPDDPSSPDSWQPV